QVDPGFRRDAVSFVGRVEAREPTPAGFTRGATRQIRFYSQRDSARQRGSAARRLAVSRPHCEIFAFQPFTYSNRKPLSQRFTCPTEGEGKCIVQNSVSVSQ